MSFPLSLPYSRSISIYLSLTLSLAYISIMLIMRMVVGTHAITNVLVVVVGMCNIDARRAATSVVPRRPSIAILREQDALKRKPPPVLSALRSSCEPTATVTRTLEKSKRISNSSPPTVLRYPSNSIVNGAAVARNLGPFARSGGHRRSSWTRAPSTGHCALFVDIAEVRQDVIVAVRHDVVSLPLVLERPPLRYSGLLVRAELYPVGLTKIIVSGCLAVLVIERQLCIKQDFCLFKRF